MAVKNYGIRDQWTNLDKLNNVDIKSVDGVIESVKINGEEAGGGGSSDFSTATLTLTNTTENLVVCEVPCYRDGAEILSSRAVVFGAVGDEPTTATFNVVCKSNGATLTIVSEGATVATSGDIQYIEAEHLYIITGDCTITIS